MLIPDRELNAYPELRQELWELRKLIDESTDNLSLYDLADRLANRNQKYHKIFTILAASSGTVALLFAILQLSQFFPGPWPTTVEVFAAIIALFSVVIGLVQSRHGMWLLERFKAEQYRLLKFRVLIDPDLWSSDISGRDRWTNRIKEEIAAICNAKSDSIDKYISGREATRIKNIIFSCHISPQLLLALVNYYKTERLHVQMDFFLSREDKNKYRDDKTRNLPPTLFFLSIMFVFSHFIIDIVFAGQHYAHFFSVLFVVFAAALPVIGAGIRTVRSAMEFARSASLYRAKYTTLSQLEQRLNHLQGCDAILPVLWQCEELLEDEHIEWLRLMKDAEWFG